MQVTCHHVTMSEFPKKGGPLDLGTLGICRGCRVIMGVSVKDSIGNILQT